MTKKLGSQQINLINLVLESEQARLIETINTGRLDDKLDGALREREYQIRKILEVL